MNRLLPRSLSLNLRPDILTLSVDLIISNNCMASFYPTTNCIVWHLTPEPASEHWITSKFPGGIRRLCRKRIPKRLRLYGAVVYTCAVYWTTGIYRVLTSSSYVQRRRFSDLNFRKPRLKIFIWISVNWDRKLCVWSPVRGYNLLVSFRGQVDSDFYSRVASRNI